MAFTLHPPCPTTTSQCPCHPAINTGLRPSWLGGPKALQYRSALTPLSLHVIGTQRHAGHKLDLGRQVEGWMDGGRERERKDREYTQRRLSSVKDNWMSSVSRDSYNAGLFHVTLICKEHRNGPLNSLSYAVLFRAFQEIYTGKHPGKHPFDPVFSLPLFAALCSRCGHYAFFFLGITLRWRWWDFVAVRWENNEPSI